MENKLYGHNQEGVERGIRKTFMGNRYLTGCMVALCLTILTGCSTIKKASLIGASAGLGATAGSVIAGGAIAPIAGSMVGASVASVVTDSTGNSGPTQPLEITGQRKSYDINISVKGGGLTGQAGAIRLGIARALNEISSDFRPVLKEAGFLTRDAREVERKKYGQPGARKKFQFSKR